MSSSSSSSTAVEESFVAQNLASVLSNIQQTNSPNARLVAVSKTKPNALLQEAYDAGQRYFGENYVQELCGKVSELPDDIMWHFIGPLQSNKAATLVKTVGLKQLHCVETVATLKLAKKLDRAVSDLKEEDENENEQKLNIYLQVNTSGEDSKSGARPGEELIALAKSITDECPQLCIKGLMTIGASGDLSCFDTLNQCRTQLAAQFNWEECSLDLSMGMSNDYVDAIERGATSVRVGSTIFGARDYSNK